MSGHGPVGTKEDLLLLQEHIRAMQALVARCIAADMPVDEIVEQAVPAPFNVCRVICLSLICDFCMTERLAIRNWS